VSARSQAARFQARLLAPMARHDHGREWAGDRGHPYGTARALPAPARWLRPVSLYG